MAARFFGAAFLAARFLLARFLVARFFVARFFGAAFLVVRFFAARLFAGRFFAAFFVLFFAVAISTSSKVGQYCRCTYRIVTSLHVSSGSAHELYITLLYLSQMFCNVGFQRFGIIDKRICVRPRWKAEESSYEHGLTRDLGLRRQIASALAEPEIALTVICSGTIFRPAGTLPGCTERAGTREVRR
ncbi:MAG: hypothetical protein WCE62_20290 [Polyangiales bacterium]